MKKSIYLLGMAVAALSSCSQSDVVEMPENTAIKFNSFVNNNTRTATPVETTVSKFFVFGEYGDADNNYGTKIFNNEPSTAIHYWEATKSYAFGAYADGEGGELDDEAVSFEANTQTLTFTNYAPQKDGKDLIAAVAKHQTDGDVTNETAVSLPFEHMLSRVKFTFKTTDADAYTIKISNLRIEGAVSKATGTYKGTDKIDWSITSESAGYAYNDILDVAMKESNYTASDEQFVIPQASTNTLKVKFTATVSGLGLVEKSSTFEAELGYDPAATEKGTANTWTPGYIYNYIATINADQINPDLEDQKILFTTTVENWKDANDTDNGELTGTPVQP